MRDYAELIKALWLCNEPTNECPKCPRYGTDNCHGIFKDAADAIEELLAAVPTWISVEERLPERLSPTQARRTVLVRLSSGCIKTLFYEFDNSARCRPGSVPLFDEGWEKTGTPVTHWMPLPAPPKEVLPNGEV